MAVPSYTTDLLTFDDASTATNWLEFTGYTASAPPDVDTDYAIYGSSSITADRAKTGLSSIGSTATTVTLPTNGAFFVWSKFLAPNSLATIASGGIRVGIGSSSGNFDLWYVGGSDTYAYGGWKNYAVDPLIGSPDDTQGTPTGTYSAVCMAWNLPTQAPSKGNPFSVDIIRYGRGESIFTGGETSDYATFLGYSTVNDNSTGGRFGLIQAVAGGYLYKGLMSLGTTATAVDMRDSNVSITIDDTLTVSSVFNRIEVNNASSNIEWTSVLITKVGLISKGQFEMIDNATVTKTGCTFTDMDTFIYQNNATIDGGTTYRRCGLVTQGGSTITDCNFDSSTSTIALLVDNNDVVSYCSFTSSGTGHAVQGFDVAGDYTLVEWSFDGYAATNGTTGNEAIYVTATTGIVNLYLTGGTSPTIRTAGATVNVIQSSTLTIGRVLSASDVYVYRKDDKTLLSSADPISALDVLVNGVQYYKLVYSYNAAVLSGVEVQIKVFNLGYVNIRQDYTLTSSDSRVEVQQRIDRNYLNP